MNKKIEWLKRGMTANNGLHMQEVCDQIADATTEINNSLQKPTTAPSATQIVAVDNTNTQAMLNIGDGLSVENGSLKASGGAGTKKYMHYIRFMFSVQMEGTQAIYSIGLNTQFISTKADKFTKETLFNFLQDEYNVPDMNIDNTCFIYSPAVIPNINISKFFFSRNDDVSLSKIEILWYLSGTDNIQTVSFTKDSENLSLLQEHIFEL